MRTFLRVGGFLLLLLSLSGLISCSCSSRRGYYVGQVAGQPVNIHFCDVSPCGYDCKLCSCASACTPPCTTCTPTIIYHRVGNCYTEGCSLLPEPLLFYEPLPFRQASGGER